MPVIKAVDAVLCRLPPGGQPLVVITGGEPLDQRDGLESVVTQLRARRSGMRLEVETSGTVSPGAVLAESVDLFTVSPKLAHAQVSERVRIRTGVLREFAAMTNTVFKFVVRDHDDLAAVEALRDEFEMRQVLVMPLGRSSGEVLDSMRRLAPEVARRGWRLSPRLHIDLWGDEPGR